MTLAPTSVPTDETGEYPALVGYAPSATGERVTARLLDGFIGGVAGAIINLTMLGSLMSMESSGGQAGVALMVGLVLTLGMAAWSLFMILAKGTTIGGFFVGLRNVDVRTGQISGGKTFVKYFLEGLIGGLTFGLGLLLLFLTLKPPLGRHWFDRTAGVMSVNIKRGRVPGTYYEGTISAPATPVPPPIQQVGVPGVSAPTDAPAADLPSLATAKRIDDPIPTSSSSLDSWAPAPAFTPPPMAPGEASFPSVPAPTFPAHDPTAEPAAAPAPIPPAFTPPPVPRISPTAPAATPKDDRQPEQADGNAATQQPSTQANERLDRTVARPFASALQVKLDDGTAVTINGVVLLGRNPALLTGFEHARIVVVNDPGRSVSKTHLAIGPDTDGIWIEDLNSANGVGIGLDGQRPERIAPNVRHTVPVGSRVQFGDRSFTVTAS